MKLGNYTHSCKLQLYKSKPFTFTLSYNSIIHVNIIIISMLSLPVKEKSKFNYEIIILLYPSSLEKFLCKLLKIINYVFIFKKKFYSIGIMCFAFIVPNMKWLFKYSYYCYIFCNIDIH